MQGFSPYIESLAVTSHMLSTVGIEYRYWALSGDSYVDRARNTICEKFLESDATDLLFWDSDMAIDCDGIGRILESDYLLTGAAYPVKNNWEHYGVMPIDNDGKLVVDGNGLIEAEYVPAGYMRIKRELLLKFKEAYPEDYYYDCSADPANKTRKYHNFFYCDIVKHQRYGEDVRFCRKVREMGEKIWIEPRIKIGHYGIKEWVGRYSDLLKKEEKI
jgi:hypothetical protein